MSPVARTTRQTRRSEMVARMLGVVEDLIEDGEPFASISVERLITRAGISRSTFYVYFEDKGALLLALAEDVAEQLIAAAQEIWDLPAGSSRAAVEDGLRGLLDVYRRHSRVWDSVVAAAAYDDRVHAEFRRIIDRATGELTNHIKAGQNAGSVRAEVDPRRTAQWLTWMTERGLHQLTPGAGPAELERLCRAQADIVWQTLYAGA